MNNEEIKQQENKMDNIPPEIENNLKAIMNLDYKLRDTDHVNYELNKILFQHPEFFNPEKFAIINTLLDELSSKVGEYFAEILKLLKEKSLKAELSKDE